MPTIADLARAGERVFPTLARVERYYPATASEEARGVLGRCLDRGEGPALLIGAPGTGKSMLLEVLADDLGKNRPVVCLTSAQLCTRRALLQSILFELGQPHRQRDEGDLRLTLMDYLSGDDVRRTGVLMLVDEAQALPIRLLEELRVLGNISHRGVPTVRLLLAGSQSLEETFTEPEIEAFNQRIVARCYLAPLSHFDTAQFIRGHLAAAGASPDEVFTPDALDAVYRATDGIARLVNQVCDRALWLAAGHGQLQVTKQIVEGAWADLQQLPTPWNLPDTPALAEADGDDDSQVVEFGPLSDDGDNVQLESQRPQVHATVDEFDEFDDTPDDVAAVVDETEQQHGGQPVETRVYQPAVAEEPQSLDAAIEVATAPDACQSSIVSSTTASPPAVPSAEVLFGDDFDEEEVVIDAYAPLAKAIPDRRPRVTSACDADLGRLLAEVAPPLEAVAAAPSPALPEDTDDVEAVSLDDPFEQPFAKFSVVEREDEEEALEAIDELPMDATELDDEDDELLKDVTAMAAETREIAAADDTDDASAPWARDDVDVLVIEDELTLPIHTAAAHRADYRQLFRNLRDD